MLEGRISQATLQRINYCKCKHRTEFNLKEWSEDNYYSKQDKALSLPADFKDEIERIHVNDITVEEFIETYERGNRPVII